MPKPNLPRRARTVFLLVCAVSVCPGPLACAADAPAVDRAAAALQQREIATRELERARYTAGRVRQSATAARQELDDFVAGHFDALHSRCTAPSPVLEESAEPATSPHAVEATGAEREAQQVEQQLRDLAERRNELMRRFTAAHPEVVDVASRLGELSSRLIALRDATSGDRAAAKAGQPSTSVDRRLQRQMAADRQRDREAVEVYQQYFERWRSAEGRLAAAIAAEQLAAERLAQLPMPPTTPPVVDSTTPPPSARPAPVATVSTPTDGSQHGSSTLALAALMIALAVAALAAVTLARASNEASFASVDDVSAALALPVVGVVPLRDSARGTPQHGRIRRAAVLVGELVIAILAISLIGYGLQSPTGLWNALTGWIRGR